MELTPDEKSFLTNLLSQITIKVADKDASQTVSCVQGILSKLG